MENQYRRIFKKTLEFYNIEKRGEKHILGIKYGIDRVGKG